MSLRRFKTYTPNKVFNTRQVIDIKPFYVKKETSINTKSKKDGKNNIP